MAVSTSIVFVVDDDISVRESLEFLIRNEGWQPETFGIRLFSIQLVLKIDQSEGNFPPHT